MSRIGKMPIQIPDGVKVALDKNKVTVSGLRGEIVIDVPDIFDVNVSSDTIEIKPRSSEIKIKALWGTFRSLINNAVYGVVNTYKKNLELVGVGFRATKNGENITLLVGFSHPVIITPPAGITFDLLSDTKISVIGIDKALVGQVAANIRKVRKPEPYKGKGIRYEGEYVRRKAGKAGKVGATT